MANGYATSSVVIFCLYVQPTLVASCADFDEFHKRIAWAANPYEPNKDKLRETYHCLLKKKYKIVSTHGYLHAHDIMIMNGRVSGIIDWEFPGWLPEYWDFTSIFRGRRYGEFDDFVRMWKYIPINAG